MIPRVDTMDLLDQAQDDIRVLLKFARVVQGITCGCYMLNMPCVCPMGDIRGEAALMLHKYIGESVLMDIDTVDNQRQPTERTEA